MRRGRLWLSPRSSLLPQRFGMMGRRPSLERVIFEKLGSLASCGSHGMCGHTMCSDWIRTYPPRFGLHLASLFDKLVNSRCDPPEIPVDLASMPLPAFFEGLSWESDLCVGGCIFGRCLVLHKGKPINGFGPHLAAFVPGSLVNAGQDLIC